MVHLLQVAFGLATLSSQVLAATPFGPPQQQIFGQQIHQQENQKKNSFDAKSLVQVPTIQKWVATPNGEGVAVTVKTFDYEAQSSYNQLWMLPVNAQFQVQPVPAFNVTKDSLFTWLSNSSLAVLQPSGATSWDLVSYNVNYTVTPPAYPPSISHPHLIHRFEILVRPTHLEFSPASSVLAVVTNAYLDERLDTILEQDEEDIEAGQGWEGGWVYEGVWARYWDTWTRRKQPRLFLGKLRATEKAWKLEGNKFVAPLVGTGIIPLDIKMSEKSIAIVSKDPSVHKSFHTRTNLYTLSLLSSDAKPQLLSSGVGGQSSSPTFNGDKIAWLEQSQDGNAKGQRKLWIFDGAKKWEVEIADYDLSPSKVVFSLSGEALNLITEHETESSIYHIWTPESQTSSPRVPTLIETNHTIHHSVHVGITPLQHSHLISLKSSIAQPPELYMTSHSPYEDPADNLEEIRLTDFTANATSAALDLTQGQGEKIWVKSSNDINVQARIFFPPSSKEASPLPLLILIMDDSWRDEWTAGTSNPNVLVTLGFVVVQINPTGSSGYSTAFQQIRRGEWGAQPMDDISAVLQHVLSSYSQVDSSKTFALGVGAYGGWAINWIQVHNDDFKFKGLISQGGIFSTTDIVYEIDESFWPEWEFVGLPGDNSSTYNKWNPTNLVWNAKTPQLFIHGGKDYRVPETQSIAGYNALQRQGVPSRLLYFPTENHIITDELNIAKWYTEVALFLQQQL